MELLEDAADDPELLLCASKVLANLTLDAGVAWVPADLAALQRTAGVRGREPGGTVRNRESHTVLHIAAQVYTVCHSVSNCYTVYSVSQC